MLLVYYVIVPRSVIDFLACKGLSISQAQLIILDAVLYLVLTLIFQKSNELLSAAQSRGGVTFAFKNEQGRVQRSLQEAEKDNNFIYHDKVPDIKSLPSIQKATIAKPAPFPTKPMSEKFTGQFLHCFICYAPPLSNWSEFGLIA